jgi:superoxide dismutase, Fe-Mn family|tara:strand:- start:26283 stop:27008 length:726 start_codon:yes stop_codon:yes gene_type:complete
MNLSKRIFIKNAALSFALLASSSLIANTAFAKKNFINNFKFKKTMPIELPDLPYKRNALEPFISEETLNYHYGKHHQAYVTNLNKLITGTDLENKTLEEIIKISANDDKMVGIFNNAAQVWNHSFYWNSMKPNGGGKPLGDLLAKIEADFGSYENFISEFKNAGATQFGSGWAWLVLEDNKLKVTKTANAHTPLTTNAKPLMTMDVWEHAYYLDYQNARPNYIEIFLEKLVNWDFVAKNLS